MGQQKRVFPAELELKILKILWREGPLRVREVRRHLAYEGRELAHTTVVTTCLLYTSPSPRDLSTSRMPSSA